MPIAGNAQFRLKMILPIFISATSILTSFVEVSAFAIVSHSERRMKSYGRFSTSVIKSERLHYPLCATSKNDYDGDDDEDDDENMDDEALGDWRKFRASLISSGLPGDDSQPKKAATENKPVAVQNEKLLAEQSEELAKEYRSGVWAHLTTQPEVGGLLCRMPLEAEFYYGVKTGYWKEKLGIMLNSGNGGQENDDITQKEEEGEISSVSKWFSITEKMITSEMEAITSSDKVKDGILDPSDLDDNAKLLLKKYLQYKQTWQEVCLVLSHDPESGCSEVIVINRPISKGIDRTLAKVLLEGGGALKDGSGSGSGNFGEDFVDKFLEAFDTGGVVYHGGDNSQLDPAVMVHGISDLPGAMELAPGTGIYRGGIEAAVEGIMSNKYNPLDFRFFYGRKSYDPAEHPERGVLLQKVQDVEYKMVACARSVALKQCLALPKPLWHEVLELCGGEMKSISSIELQKRVDIN